MRRWGKYRNWIIAGLAICAVSARPGLADTVSDSVDIRVDVVPACSIESTTPIEFPNPNTGADTGAVGEITVNCVDQLPYEVALDAGSHFDSGSLVRTMQNGSGDRIAYKLYQDSGRTTEWGDSSQGNTYPNGDVLPGTGSGSDQAFTVYGQAVKDLSTIAPAGEYSDSVNVTLHF